MQLSIDLSSYLQSTDKTTRADNQKNVMTINYTIYIYISTCNIYVFVEELSFLLICILYNAGNLGCICEWG